MREGLKGGGTNARLAILDKNDKVALSECVAAGREGEQTLFVGALLC